MATDPRDAGDAFPGGGDRDRRFRQRLRWLFAGSGLYSEDGDPFAEQRTAVKAPMRRLFTTFGRRYWRSFGLGLGAGVVARFVDLLPPLILGLAIDAIFTASPGRLAIPYVPEGIVPASQMGQFWFATGLIAAAFLITSAFNWLRAWGLNTFAQNVQHDLADSLGGLLAHRVGIDRALVDDRGIPRGRRDRDVEPRLVEHRERFDALLSPVPFLADDKQCRRHATGLGTRDPKRLGPRTGVHSPAPIYRFDRNTCQYQCRRRRPESRTQAAPEVHFDHDSSQLEHSNVVFSIPWPIRSNSTGDPIPARQRGQRGFSTIQIRILG